MKIGLFDPYLDTLGGGERYTLTLAEYLLKGHQVEIFWHDKKIINKAKERFNLKLSGIKIDPNFHKVFTREKNLFKKFTKSRLYDLIFYLSDGSIPFLSSRKNILHFQVPFTQVNGQSLINKMKLKLINRVVCNSKFTKQFIDQEFGVESQVIYPPVAVEEFFSGESPRKKEKMILSVGRFEPTLHSKKQEIMIEVFQKMIRKGLSNWQLILVGGLSKEYQAYFNKLKKQAKNLPIKLFSNLDFKNLKKFYSQAKIYWHAAGFDVDENKNPEKVEHFGMTTVEAMAAGCVPVVCAKGGQKEIVGHGLDGFLWEREKELIKYTREIIKKETLETELSRRAILKSQQFSKKVFCQKFQKLITNL